MIIKRLLCLLLLVAGCWCLATSATAGLEVKRPASQGLEDGLVGYWPFNGADISGTIAYDRSAQGNNGTIAGSPLKVVGKLGQALNLDGVNDAVTVADHSSLDCASAVTISAWFYPRALNSGWHIIAAKGASGTNSNYGLWHDGNQFTITFGDQGWINHYTVQTYTPGRWYHLVGIIDSTNDNARLYVNGQLDIASQTETTDMVTNNDAFMINADYGGNWSDGIIDEVRVYNRALSTAEVTRLYNIGKGVATAAPQQNKLTTGLVGYWPFNGPDISGNTVYDRSPVGTNNGTLNGALRAAGKLGQGLYFDGSDGGVSVPHSSSINLTSSMTLATWVKPSDPVPWHGAFFEKQPWNATYHFGTACSNPQGIAYLLGGTEIFELANVLFPDRWTHVAVTFDDTTDQAILYLDGIESNQNTYTGTIPGSTGNLAIGYRAGTPGQAYKGVLDDMRMYNRALSADEVKALYNQAASRYQAGQQNQLTTGLVGYWPFNGPDISGNVAYDRSGQGNSGTMVGPPLKVIGKIGQGLKFNGTNAYVSIPNNVNTYLSMTQGTISLWYKADNSPDTYLFDFNADGDGIEIVFTTVHSVALYHRADYGTWQGVGIEIPSITTDTAWHHIVGTWQVGGSPYTLSITFDGVQTTDTDAITTPSAYSGDAIIGAVDGGGSMFWKGTIDEVRIYNRALSAEEVKRLYNLGR